MYNIDIKNLRLGKYRRKSSEDEDRQVASLPDQDTALDELTKRFNIHHSQIVVNIEESKSAKQSGTRPGFKEGIKLVEKGRINAIMAWHADRLSRNLGDVHTLIELLESGKLVAIFTPQYLFGNTPIDKYVLATQCLNAKLENDNKGVNVKRGLASKVKKGWRPGGAPIGYLNDKTQERGERGIIPDPQRFNLVRQMWDLFLTGNYSVSQIRDLANNEWNMRTRKTKKMGGSPLHMSHVYRIFNNPFYYGWYWWKDQDTRVKEFVKGKHELMITKEQYDRAQLLLGKRGRPQPKTRSFAYTGTLITCGECGCAISAEEKNQLICTNCKHKFSYENKFECPKCNTEIAKMKSPTILNYVYYRCTKKRRDKKCTQKFVRVDELERQVAQELKALEIDEHYLKLALDYLNEKKELEVQDKVAIKKSLQETHNDVETRLKRLNSEYTSPQNLDYSIYTPEEFKVLKAELLQEREGLERKMRNVQAEFDKWLELSEQTFNFCAYAWFHFTTNSDLQKKRTILASLGSNLTLRDKKLNIQAFKPYLMIKEALITVRAEKARLEPTKSPYFKGKKAALAAPIPNKQGLVDDVRTSVRACGSMEPLRQLMERLVPV